MITALGRPPEPLFGDFLEALQIRRYLRRRVLFAGELNLAVAAHRRLIDRTVRSG